MQMIFEMFAMFFWLSRACVNKKNRSVITDENQACQSCFAISGGPKNHNHLYLQGFECLYNAARTFFQGQ